MPSCPSGSICERSIAWALGNVDGSGTPTQEDLNRVNHYSYRDARNAMWGALTREFNKHTGQSYAAVQREADSIDRMYLWATTFRSLGDVVHLLEDTAQPQHTRNDPHSFLQTGEQQAFESYTNARVLGGTTANANSYVQGFFGGPQALTPPPLGTYPIAMFSTPLRFFTMFNSPDGTGILTNAGLADYTNRGFFTGGTLPPDTAYGTPHVYPPQTFTQGGVPINGYSIVLQRCSGLQDADSRLRAVTCQHYVHDVPDVVDPDYAQNPNAQNHDLLPQGYTLPDVPIASESIFSQILDQATTIYVPRTAISTDELDAMGNLTIPRAVGYVTGMLNYFFRGTLQVTAPIDGIYAIVNHGMPHTVDADGYPICSQTVASPADNTKNLCTAGGIFGFTSVRVNVQNTTPAATESGTNLPISKATGGTNAKMVAVARYHRNPCYKPDLSGEPSNDSTGAPRTPINCSSPRTAYPEISVSAEVPVAPGMLDGQNPVEQEFNFSNDPIPINATDVFIQVAYRGPLGAETDGIAVGMVDVSEPTYDALWAMTDIPLQYQGDGSTWIWSPWTSPPWSTWWTLPPPDPTKDLAVTGVVICEGQWQIYNSTSGEHLPEDHVVRIATIRDFSSNTVTHQDIWQGVFGPWSRSGSASIDASIHQADDEQGHGWLSGANFYGRGIVFGDTGTYDYIPTCTFGNCPLPPFPPPSPWSLADVAPPASGFISEPIGIGNESLPRKTACPIH